MQMNPRTLMIGLFLLLTGLLASSDAMAVDGISVLKIDTLVMEKGSDTYSLSVKAFVKNNSGSDNLAINLVALDSNGFELHNATLGGTIEQGKTRVLIGVVKIPKDVYDEIVKWEWKQ